MKYQFKNKLLNTDLGTAEGETPKDAFKKLLISKKLPLELADQMFKSDNLEIKIIN